MEIKIEKFSDSSNYTYNGFMGTKIGKIAAKVLNGETLLVEDKLDIVTFFSFRNGKIQFMGWEVDFRPVLRRYVFKLNEMWTEGYYFSVEQVRIMNCLKEADEVYEIPNKCKLIYRNNYGQV